MTETCARCGEPIPVARGRDVLSREPMVVRHATEAECIEALKRPRWQPIDTAPKDDDEVLLAWPREHAAAGEWCVQAGYWFPGGWLVGEGYEVTPTHWMPLPEPPK